MNLVSDCSMDLGLNWVDISDHHHEADIGLEWVDISEPELSTDIGLHWHDISKPELKADLGIEWHDISETKLDGDIGLHWHDMHFEEMHIEAGPCDCDDLGDAMLLQEQETPLNLSGHVDNAYDEYYHHDPIQDDRLGGEIHTFHESLADFFPDGQDHFDVPLNLQYEGNSGANVWFPMEEGENWLQPRGRRVE